MKIRQGFVSNSSSSSFIVALPKTYEISEEEMGLIRECIEDYDCYFSYYEELAEEAGETELLDERERIQKMLESGNFEEPANEEPVNDDVKNADIKKGFEYLTTIGSLWTDDLGYETNDTPMNVAAKAIIEVLKDKIIIGSLNTASDCGQILNVLADGYRDSAGINLIKRNYIEELKKEI